MENCNVIEKEKKSPIKSHQKEKVTCGTCGKSYVDPNGLRRHKLTAHAGKRWQCNHCYKKFTRHDSLKYHNSVYHRKDVSNEIKQSF